MVTDAAGIHLPSVPLHSTAAEADFEVCSLQSDKVLSAEAIMLVMGLFRVS